MIPVPLIKGLMSRITPAEKQGALFAGIGAVAASCNVLGAVFANGIYTATVSIYRGFVYLMMAACCVLAMVFLLVLKHGIKQTDVISEGINEKSQKSNGPQITKM